MELGKKLRESGWYFTDEGLKVLSTAVGCEEPRKIIDEALNRDIRDIGGGALPTKREDASVPGRIVLQVQRIRNISAPKANEESKAAPRFLQLDLSDGQTSIQALELEPVPQLSLNVAPGTKVYFKAEKLQLIQGFVVLRSSELQILGGRVDALYEKWDLARTMLKYARSGRPLSGTSAPPPWVAFGKKIDSTADRNFKSLGSSGDKEKPVKENDEFNAMRSEAIAEATKAGGKKVFGGGGQNIVDHNIKKILDKGFTEDEARSALHATRNNLERALFNLKRRKEAGGVGPIESMGRPGRGERPGREGKRGASSKDEAEAPKPAANATLFDFLTTKLPASEAPAPSVPETFASIPAAPNTANHYNPFKQYGSSRFGEPDSKPSLGGGGGGKFGDRSRFENNVSSSFAAHRGGHGGSSRGGGRRGGGRDERPPRDEKPHREERPPREERPAREERPPRDRGGALNDRVSGRHKPEQSAGKATNRNGLDNPSGKSAPEVKTEPETTNGKDQAGNRRGSDRGSNRGGSNRGENGNANGNRRKQQGGSSSGASTIPGSAKSGEDFSARLSKVTEETANLKVSSAPKRENRRRQGQGNRQGGAATGSEAQPQQQPPAQLPTQKSNQKNQQSQQNQHHNHRQNSQSNYSQLPNGYTYDPSKIMGFQSKEANEFAMSLLKSQGVGVAGQQQQQQEQLQKLQAASFVSAPGPPTNAHPHPQPPQAVSGPQAVPRDHFGMTPGDAWMWKKGDLCMAKYWDDGRYYEAEITGVSEKTCVVFFLGYGNHEEVLKLDILPIMDAQNRPLSNAPSYQQMQSQPPPQHPHSRFRSDRQAQQQQVYVPPHKREH